MLKKQRNAYRAWLSGVLAVLALLLFLGAAPLAIAAEEGGSHSSGGGHGDSHAGKGQRGGSGHASDEEHGSTHIKGKGRGGQGGHGREEGVTSDRGRRPVWAREGLPEVELGRLNAARAPERVLMKALGEAHSAMEADPQADVHSRPQNLALYWEAMSGQGSWSREDAAAFLGAAADKRIPITTDTVRALNLILGVADDDPAGMALAADSVRQRLLAEHDASGAEGH